MSENSYDIAVIGGGLVGLACAFTAAVKKPGLKIAVIEKETALAFHQSSRNSGVLHAGVYYKPGSEKARNCLRGKKMLEDFCVEHSLPMDRCGKIIVATDESEFQGLEELTRRATANGVSCRLISSEEAKEREPHVNCKKALLVNDTGIADFPKIADKLGDLLKSQGGRVLLNHKVTSIEQKNGSTTIVTSEGPVEARNLVNCAGLYCDKIMQLSGTIPPCRIIPFRGEYYMLTPEARGLCKALIYPVPDPRFPFLGVHFTRMIGGEVECGPNAVFALAREGYSWTKISPSEFMESIRYTGFRKMAMRYWKEGLQEIGRSLSKSKFITALQRLIPEIRSEYLVPTHAGVRAQAILPNGNLVDDFLIEENSCGIHVLNAPSPAATSCLSIGETIWEKLKKRI